MKILNKILCFFKHKTARRNNLVWCVRCGVAKYWTGQGWVPVEGKVCTRCGGWVEGQSRYGGGSSEIYKCRCGENNE